MPDCVESQSTATGYRTRWEKDHVHISAGAIETPHGFVLAYSESNERSGDYTRLTFVRGGTLYERTWDKRYSERYMITLAKHFAREIVVEETHTST